VDIEDDTYTGVEAVLESDWEECNVIGNKCLGLESIGIYSASRPYKISDSSP
jgi:hypothetical protein